VPVRKVRKNRSEAFATVAAAFNAIARCYSAAVAPVSGDALYGNVSRPPGESPENRTIRPNSSSSRIARALAAILAQKRPFVRRPTAIPSS